MNKIRIIDNKKDWDAYIDKMYQSDFYYTYDYHNISIDDNYKAQLFVYEEDENTICLPLIIRPIPDNDGFFDATSVYGYAGPLTSVKEIPQKIIENFQKALSRIFVENNIIAVFSRLHPYFENEKYIGQLGEVVSLSETVYIDLRISPEEQYRQYRRDVKSRLKGLVRDGFTVYEDNELKYLKEFIRIYNENMKRVNAAPMYFFPDDYYDKFFKSPEIGARLYFVMKDNEIAAGSIIVFSKTVIQYHLSATAENYLKNSPVRLLLDYVRLQNTGKQQDIFHLGGGVGNAKDSLFNFKAGFSKARLTFKIWKYIVNEQKYNELCEKEQIPPDEPYFPAYRAKNKLL